MPRPPSRPIFVLIPGASQNPSHYAYLLHLLHKHAYPTLSALLPSTGSGENITAQDDTDYILNHLLLPVLDTEKHDIIIITHSYSSIPSSAAVLGLGKTDRVAVGKTTSVIGQICIAALLVKGGDGKDLVTAFGGKLPPHMGVDESTGLITCEDPAPSLYGDVSPQAFQDAAVLATLCPSLASFKSPCPRASWDSKAFEGRVAYIRTVKDKGIPYEMQNMMIQGTGVEWIIKDIDTEHSPQLVEPEKLCDILLELAKRFEEM